MKKPATGTKCPSKKIGLMGPFGYGNLGDAAIQDAMIQHVRKYFPDAEIFGFSLNPEDTEKRHGIKSYPISRMAWAEEAQKGVFNRLLNWLKSHPNRRVQSLERWIKRGPMEFGLIASAYKTLKGFDYFIVSGGGQLDDYWGGGGPWSHPYTMLKWGFVSKLRRVKFMFVSVGAGPVHAKLSQIFVRWALSLAQYRSYRDEYSSDYVKKIVGYPKDDPVYPDLAFSLQMDQYAPAVNVPNPRPIVAIGPIGYFRDGCWPEHDPALYEAYLTKFSSFVGWLIQKGYAILFIPGEVYFDQIAIDDVKAKLQNELGDLEGKILEVSIQSVSDLLSYLHHTQFVVASRFHNILLSQILLKPVLALSYQAKIDFLMAAMEQGEYCLPVGSFDEEQLKQKFEALVAHETQIPQQLRPHVQQFQQALAEQYDRIFGKS